MKLPISAQGTLLPDEGFDLASKALRRGTSFAKPSVSVANRNVGIREVERASLNERKVPREGKISQQEHDPSYCHLAIAADRRVSHKIYTCLTPPCLHRLSALSM